MTFVAVAVVVALFAGCVKALMLANEEKKAFDRAREAERLIAQKRRFDALMRAQEESRINIHRHGDMPQNRRVG